MQLCDDGHDEVCYETRRCPVCAKQAEVDDLESQCSDYQKEINELNAQKKEE